MLFVVEDTAAMAAMQPVLQGRVMAMLEPILQATKNGGASLDLHIGVITTDLGAGTRGAPGCAAWPGRGGQLQALGAAAVGSCRAPVGLPYLKYDFNPYHPAGRNLPDGQDLATTLGCMLSVGSGGCGYARSCVSCVLP